ncbi:MAG TPA: hypothetical protein VND99_02190 [Candidatus Acidoferrales bacterium]|nr:hypothetical protein [Candidatus Acidoferrales bacterium]
MKAMKSKGILIVIGIIVLILIGGGGYFVLSNNAKQTTQDQTFVDNSVQSLSPSAIGLKLEASPDKKKVRFTIAKASDIKGIEYELTYDANSTAQERSEGSDATVQRGITGQSNISAGSSTYQSSWLILGSQSASVVRYDTGVKSINITLKITKTDNKIFQVQDTLSL